MNKLNLEHNKGFILVASYMVIALLVILATGFATRSIGEQRVSNKGRDSIQAFWLAESGLDRAISELPDTPLSGTLGSGSYSTQTTSISSTRFLIRSKGGVPAANETDPDNIVRSITAIVEQPANEADPSGITSAITANGNITVRGSAQVNGAIDPNAIFDFEEIFGISKETMENNATSLYTDPENNVTPVNTISWANLVSMEEMIVSDSNWEGTGILVVDGNLRITGGHFRGIIWVIGTLWVSGNPIIDGAIYVESGAEFETTLTGNPTVNFDSSAISDAFGYLPSGLPPRLISWKED
jgi:Tfp pilus assembly protein PilX